MKKTNFRRTINRLLHLLARFGPGAHTCRPYLHKLRGVKIYGSVFIGEDAYIENEYPECVEIHDEAVITLRTTILAHNFGNGRIIIKRGAYIGTGCVLSASPGQTLIIGEGAVIAANSVVTKNVQDYTFVGGVPAKKIARVSVPLNFSTSYQSFKNGLIR